MTAYVHFCSLIFGIALLAIILQICIKGLRQKEVVEEITLCEPVFDQSDNEIDRLEKYERVYNHFEYHKLGLSFKDYLRKIEAGTHGELANLR